MIAMNPPRPRFEFAQPVRRWLLPATLLAMAPKCVLCVAAYLGLGANLGGRDHGVCRGAHTPRDVAAPLFRRRPPNDVVRLRLERIERRVNLVH